MQINQLAQRVNLSSKTIRYYESIGLLPPPRRLPNGYRDYAETDVERARFVAAARDLDFLWTTSAKFWIYGTGAKLPVGWY